MIKAFSWLMAAAALFFSSSVFAETFTWAAPGSGTFETPGNWIFSSTGEVSGGQLPGAGDDVVIPDGATAYTVTVNNSLQIGSLVLGGAGGSAAVTLSFNHNKANFVCGDVKLLSNAVVTHTAVKCAWFDVGGNFVIDERAQINAVGCGNGKNSGPGYYSGNQKTCSSAHGGRLAANSKPTYGSLVAPVSCGSGSANGTGGGAVRVNAAGFLTVNGSILADGADVAGFASGSGGSVYLTGKGISGSGTISANGGKAPNGGSGAGGRVSVCLSEKSGFADWSGVTRAYGGAGGISERGRGPAGTVYLQSGDGVENSKTIIDNNSLDLKEMGYVELTESTDSALLGTLIVRNKGRVYVPKESEIELLGSIDTTGGTAYFTGASVRFKGPAEATIKGNSPYGDFVCEEPGKILVFGTSANDCLTIADDGTLKLVGDETSKIKLIPDNMEKTWKVKLSDTAKSDVLYVSVCNSDASSGGYVNATSSDDEKGNKNWNFVSPIVPGESIVWTGAESTNFLSPANWDRLRQVVDTDTIVIPALSWEGANMPVLSKGIQTFNSLTVEEGASLTLSGGCSVTITNKLAVVGTLRATGTEKIVCTKDVDFEGGSFEGGDSSFYLEGAFEQMVNPNGQKFGNLFIDKENGEISFADGFSATLFDVRSSDALTLSFAPGKTVLAENCYFLGRKQDGGQALTLRSLSPGVAWKLENGGDQFVAGVAVSDSDACNGAEILADASVNAGGNSGWNFDSGIVNAKWIGGSGDFKVASNWDSASVPGANTRVFIPGQIGETQTITINSYFTVRDFIVGSRFANAKIDVVLGHNQANVVSGDVHILSGVTVSHTAVKCAWFDVGGNFVIDEGAQINAVGCGCAPRSGSGYSGGASGNQKTATASHGGRLAANSKPTYGSLVAPVSCGSGSYNGTGGGAVRVNAAGFLTVNGSILADGADVGGYASGSGGSVYLTGKGISGSGTISANGGNAPNGGSGAGGRISVCLSEKSGFADWSGVTRAYGGESGWYERGPGAAGTVYLQSGAGAENGTIIIDNAKHGLKENGYVELKKENKNWKFGTIYLKNAGRAKLMQDARAIDLNLETSDVNFNTGTNILIVSSFTHKDGKGWGAVFSSLVTRETDADTGKAGDIIWRSRGLTVIIR